MRILITNDDGIDAPGLAVLTAIATEIAGDGGEVWTVAPAFEQSGVGHRITYTHPTLLAEVGPRRFAAEGSPADCVLAGLHEVMTGAPPDLILSGVNRGNNAAENTLYSGTIGGAMEGALQGHRAIALSQYMGPATRDLDDPFEAAAATGVEVVRAILDADVWDRAARTFYSVNFPPCAAADVKGVRLAPQGMRDGAPFGVARTESPAGRLFLWVAGRPQAEPSAPGTDAAVSLDGYVSVTPLNCDLTDRTAMDRIGDRLDRGR